MVGTVLLFACGGNDFASVRATDGGAVDAQPGDGALVDGADGGGVDASPDTGSVDASTPDATDARPDGQPSTLWSRQILGPASFAKASAVDQSGHLLIAGAENLQAHVAKLDALTGAPVWIHRFGGNTDVQANVVTGGDADSVLVAGIVTAAGYDLGGGPLPVGGYLAKLNAAGQFQWQKSFFTHSSSGWIAAVMVRSSNEIVLVGHYAGTEDFGGGPLATDGLDVVVFAVDSQGNYLRAKRFSGPGDQYGGAAAMDPSGNVVLTGTFDGSIDFGGGALNGPAITAGHKNIFVARLDPNANHIASRELHDNGNNTYGLSIATDATGNVVIIGDFDNSIDLGGGSYTTFGVADIFLGKLTPTLAHVWSKQIGDPNSQIGTAVALDGAGNVLVGASMAGTVSFGGAALTSSSNGHDSTGVLARYDSNGAHLSSRILCTACPDMGVSTLLPTSTADVMLAGVFSGTLDLGQGSFASGVNFSMFIARER